MQLSGWGRYPKIDAQLLEPVSEAAVVARIRSMAENGAGPGLIPRGLGRSYGDSALAPRVMSSRYLDSFISFDATSGEINCGSGLSLDQLIALVLPRGWFPPVVPGTRFVTVGGAVASDIHGKNHHCQGSFGQHVRSLRVATVSDGVVECSRQRHPELFRATCGGMGLTGVILSVRLQLQPVDSAFIDATTWRAANLGEALELFEEHAAATYSVAWIDCSASGRQSGRSLLMLGEHSPDGGLLSRPQRRLSVPVDLPGGLLNRHTIGLFNRCYYLAGGESGRRRRVQLAPYFFPLDVIGHWNRLYGRHGFLQYQMVLPFEAGEAGLTRILTKVRDSGRGVFLAVLKSFGRGNDHYLSFPVAGYTLALDFRRDRDLGTLLNQLDQVVLDYGGRIYLTKDARMTETVFKRSYPQWQAFAEVRRRYAADRVFHSMQSTRLGL